MAKRKRKPKFDYNSNFFGSLDEIQHGTGQVSPTQYGEGGYTEPQDYSNQYNTPIPKDKQAQWDEYVKTHPKQAGDRFDYDVQGWWLGGGDKQNGANGHGPDTYKKPNHPTFSSESMYSGVNGQQGGQWINNAFVPTQTQYNSYGPGFYDAYSKRVGDKINYSPWTIPQLPQTKKTLHYEKGGQIMKTKRKRHTPAVDQYGMGGELGGLLGGVAGSIIPGVGTAIGTTAGSIVGSLIDKASQKNNNNKLLNRAPITSVVTNPFPYGTTMGDGGMTVTDMMGNEVDTIMMNMGRGGYVEGSEYDVSEEEMNRLHSLGYVFDVV